MKLGFIGYGKSVHRYHMPFICESNKFKIVGYYSKGSNEFNMKYKEIARFENLEKLFSCIDVVVISTPLEFHYEYAKKALEFGINVIVEKPICTTLTELRDLYSIADSNNVEILAYQNRRYDSDYLTIKDIIEKDLVGEVIEIESNHTHYRVDSLHKKASKFDGSVYGHGVHFIDQIIQLYGEPTELLYDYTNQRNYYLRNKDVDGVPDDYYNIILIYDNMRVRVRFSQLIVENPPRWIVNGLEGTVVKYMIDQQEFDLKKGIFPGDINFGLDRKEGVTKIFYKDRMELFDTKYKNYTQYYIDAYNFFMKNGVSPVPRKDTLILINILQTIINNDEYKTL